MRSGEPPADEGLLTGPGDTDSVQDKVSLFRVGHGFRVRNAVIYVISNGLQRGSTVIVAPILLGKLTVAEYGVYGLLLTVYTLGPALLSLGLYGATGRFYFDAKDDDERHRITSALVIAHAVTVVVITGLLDAILSTSISSIGGIPYIYFRLILWAAAASALYEGSAAYWRAAERPMSVAIAGMASVFCSTAGMTGLLFLTNLRLEGVLIGLGLGQGAVSLTMLALVIREVGVSWNAPLLRAALVFSLPLIPHFLSGWLLRAADRWILDYYRSQSEVGVYFLAMQLASLISLVMFSTNDAIGPRLLARFRDHGKQGAQAFHARVFPLYLLTASALAAGAILVGPLAVRIVSHGKITHVSLLMSILACGFVASTLYVPFSNAFFALKTTQRLFLLTASSAVLSFVLNLLLIPMWGAVGAASSLLIAYVALMSMAMWFAHRGLGLRTFAPAIAGSGAALALLTWIAQAFVYR